METPMFAKIFENPLHYLQCIPKSQSHKCKEQELTNILDSKKFYDLELNEYNASSTSGNGGTPVHILQDPTLKRINLLSL
jgi:hypothetical protein